MFLGKKGKPEEFPYDKHRIAMHVKMNDCATTLSAEVKNMVVAKSIVDLFSEGPDKEAAKIKAEVQYKRLLSAIAAYNDIRKEYIDYIERYKDNFVTTKSWPTDNIWDSYEMIKRTYMYDILKI